MQNFVLFSNFNFCCCSSQREMEKPVLELETRQCSSFHFTLKFWTHTIIMMTSLIDWMGCGSGYDDDNHEFDQSWSCCRCSKLAQQRANLPEVVSIRAHLSCRPVLLWMAMSKQRSSRCQTNSTWFRLKNNHQNDGICLCSQLKWSSWCVHVLYEQNTGSPICWW